MPRYLQLLIGPELYWLALYGIVALLAKANTAPSYPVNKILDMLWWLVILAAISVFVLWFIPGLEKNWLLLRVWIAGLVMSHFILEKGLGALKDQNPGTGTAYIIGIIAVFFVLIVGSVGVKIATWRS
mgnify:CR=1 FL=1